MLDEIIPLAQRADNAVPISYIVRTGYAPLSNQDVNHLRIDLTQTDASGVKALDAATASAFEKMRYHAGVQALLAKPSWTASERVAYEGFQADAVAHAFHEQPLFATYRQTEHSKRDIDYADLTHLRAQDELDCKTMAVFKGIMLSRVEGGLLAGGGGLKRPSEYYVVGGVMKLEGDGLPAGLHATLMSSATGNVIEATWTRHSYVESSNHASFANYVAGRPFLAERTVTKDGQPLHLEYQMASPASSLGQQLDRLRAWQAGDLEALRQATRPSRVTAPEFEEGIRRSRQFDAAIDRLGLPPLPVSAMTEKTGDAVAPPMHRPGSAPDRPSFQR